MQTKPPVVPGKTLRIRGTHVSKNKAIEEAMLSIDTSMYDDSYGMRTYIRSDLSASYKDKEALSVGVYTISVLAERIERVVAYTMTPSKQQARDGRHTMGATIELLKVGHSSHGMKLQPSFVKRAESDASVVARYYTDTDLDNWESFALFANTEILPRETIRILSGWLPHARGSLLYHLWLYKQNKAAKAATKDNSDERNS